MEIFVGTVFVVIIILVMLYKFKKLAKEKTVANNF
jgi:hypothetical protein